MYSFNLLFLYSPVLSFFRHVWLPSCCRLSLFRLLFRSVCRASRVSFFMCVCVRVMSFVLYVPRYFVPSVCLSFCRSFFRYFVIYLFIFIVMSLVRFFGSCVVSLGRSLFLQLCMSFVISLFLHVFTSPLLYLCVPFVMSFVMYILGSVFSCLYVCSAFVIPLLIGSCVMYFFLQGLCIYFVSSFVRYYFFISLCTQLCMVSLFRDLCRSIFLSLFTSCFSSLVMQVVISFVVPFVRQFALSFFM